MVNPWLPPPTPISPAKFAFVGESEFLIHLPVGLNRESPDAR